MYINKKYTKEKLKRKEIKRIVDDNDINKHILEV